MSNVNDVGGRATKWIRWIARIWGTLVIAFILLMFIGYAWNWVTIGQADPYAVEDYPPIENVPPLFALLSVLGLGLAWRWEGLGGAIAVVFNLAGLPVLLVHWPIAHDFPRYLMAPYGVWMAIAIPGILFLICWWRSKKRVISRRPQGLLRFALRLPIWLYRLHLGWLLGQRFLLLTHIGRNSGQIRQTVIEVVKHAPQSDSFFVVSGWGEKADWYRNIHKNPDVVINVGRRQLQVRAEDVPLPEAIDVLEEYARRSPLAFRELTGLFLGERLQPNRDSSQRLAELMPMVVFRTRSQSPASG